MAGYGAETLRRARFTQEVDVDDKALSFVHAGLNASGPGLAASMPQCWAGFDVGQPTVLITGANRGLGLEFARQYAVEGMECHRQLSSARSRPKTLKTLAAEFDQVSVERLDVTSDVQVDALAEKYAAQPIDVLLNNAGIYGTLEKQTLGTFDFEELKTVFDVNTIGSLRVTEAFLNNVVASEQKKVISLGGGMGTQSIGPLFGGHYFVKMSKSAHLMAMGVLQKDMKDSGIIVTMISPGRVDTQLMRDSGWTGQVNQRRGKRWSCHRKNRASG